MPNSSAAEASRPGALVVHEGIYRVAALERHPRLLHGISTRRAPDGHDWNLSAKRGTPQHPPDPQVALANREKLAARLGISLASMVGCQQVHSAQVVLTTAQDAGRGMLPGVPSFMGADAMISNTLGLHLMVLSADCPPVFLYDPVNEAIGLAHSGWKGTVGRIAANVVEEMAANFGSNPAEMIAVVGPGIGPCCYNVGPNVIEAVESAFPGEHSLLQEREGLVYFNLRETIGRTLIESGVQPENISVEEICTAHNLHTFYSHRGEAGQCGLFGAVLGLRDATA